MKTIYEHPKCLDVTKETSKCIDMESEGSELSFGYEVWFDVDQYFGICTKNDDRAWINFYTFYGKDGAIRAMFYLETDEETKEYDVELSDTEKQYFKERMNDYCLLRNNAKIEDVYYDHIGRCEEQAAQYLKRNVLTREKCEKYLNEWDSKYTDYSQFTLHELVSRYIGVSSGGSEVYHDGKVFGVRL